MTGPVFVLHDEADRAYAEQLAGALAPLAAFPSDLRPSGDREIRYGPGAICILLWSARMSSHDVAQRALDALSGMKGNAAVCRLEAAPQLNARQIEVVQASADLGATSAELRAAVARVRQRLSERGAQRGRAAPKLAHAQGSADGTLQPRAKADMPMRSAYGLAATLAVVGVIAPTVTYRAGAANLPPSAGREGSAEASAGAQAGVHDDGQGAELAATSFATPDTESEPATPAAARRADAPAEAVAPAVAHEVVVAAPVSALAEPAAQVEPGMAATPPSVAVGADPPMLVMDVSAKPIAHRAPADASGALMIAPMPPLKPAEWEYRAFAPPVEETLEGVPEPAKGEHLAETALTSGDD